MIGTNCVDPTPTDEFLIAAMLGGDAAALDRLMKRYDRLIRYTVFRASQDRCVQDPQWLESVASATWAGFIRSMQRDTDNPPALVGAYLVRIARNQVVSTLRATRSGSEALSLDLSDDGIAVASTLEEPIETLSRLELLESLRACLAELGPVDRTMATQLEAITQRRWKEAAQALGVKESTLRSRWSNTLERLRVCVQRKTAGKTFAPSEPGSDK